MRVAVVGGGISGAAIARAVEERGGEARLLSRATGFDVLRDDPRQALAGVDAVVEATGLFTTSARRATRFFEGSTRAVGGAARESGARHVLLSIVGCTLPEVQGYGYFAGKTAQEEAARATGADLAIVRSTQWHEFARQNLARMRFGPVALVPGMRIQPVALDAVAGVVADVARGARPGPVVEVAGPEATTLWEMTRALEDPGARPVPLPIPGRLGRAFAGGALLPGPGVEVIGSRFADRGGR